MKIANSSYLGFDQLPKLMFRQILTSKAKQLQNKAFIFPSGYRALGQLKRSQFPTEKELSVAVSKEKRTGAFPKSRCSITDDCNAPVGATTTKYPMKKYLMHHSVIHRLIHWNEGGIESYYTSPMQLPNPLAHWYRETAITHLGSISAFRSQRNWTKIAHHLDREWPAELQDSTTLLKN